MALVVTMFVAFDAPVAAQGASECGPNINKIACENQKLGTQPSVWDIDGAGDPTIQGFATDISVNVGQRIDFKIDTDASNYTIDIYRTGWYQGLGARFIRSVPVSVPLPQHQDECISDVTTELYDCGTWKVSASWDVPSTAVSGVYVAKLTRADDGGSSHITFIVREDGNTSDVLFQTSDPTWHAYNKYGGSNFYRGAANGRAYKISYNRPFATRDGIEARDFYFSSEYATVRFLERNGYDVSYIAGLDTDRRGGELLNHNVFMSVGHDEYWSGAQRANIEAARDAGVNLQFLTGNEGYWRTRYEPSADPSHTDRRTIVSYKETWGNSANRNGAKIDTSSPEWTGTWRDPRFATQANGGGLPENALMGTMYQVNNVYLPVTVSAQEGKTRLWRNTSLASLPAGTSAALADQTVGYESNEDVDNGFRPAGLIRLSTTVGATPEYLTDYGNTVVAGTTKHHVTLYRAASDALVFSSASVQWSWGLDSEHDGVQVPADPRMQQAQVNLLADMDAMPTTLMTGLVAPTASTDELAPTTTITSPAAGTSIANGTTVTVTGTAADVGGRVAGVEVSTDGGQRWHAAEGTTSWTYTYIQQGAGAKKIIARAIDDSANFSQAGVSRDITVTGPYSVFGVEAPAIASANDAGAVELGLKFTPDSDGFVTGVRFYKGPANTGTHTGSLWNAAGVRVANVTFTGESATGWQTAQFAAPVQVNAGSQYTVSYSAPNGGYSMTDQYWPYKATASSPLTVAPSVGAAAAGVFGSIGTRPTDAYRESNYFVDVVFDKSDTSPLRIASRTPLADAGSIALDAPVTATFTRDANPASVSITVKDAGGTAVPGTVAYTAATKTARFSPTAPLVPSTVYTVTVAASDAEGVALAPNSGWTFTTQAADRADGDCPCSLFRESDRPVLESSSDTALVTLGTRFTVSVAGQISALKFFKGAGNPGPRTVDLWRADTGARLASANVTSETSSGWQTVQLAQPVDVVPGTTYVVSYLAPQGGYSVTLGQFSGSGYTRGPLTVPSDGGAFTYSNSFPDRSSATSYAVDVVFAQAQPAPSATTFTPTQGALAASASTPISVRFTQPIASGYTGTVRANGTAVAGAWSLSGDAKTLTFAPSAALPAGAAVSVQVTGIVGTSGVHGTDVAWSFTVADAALSVATLFGESVPQVQSDTAEPSSVELGTAFRSSVAGTVRAIRFFKGAGNGGSHVGSLWSSNGTRLAEVTFTGETASGWQRALLDTPVRIDPGVTYTVSYLAPQGGYAHTGAGLATAVTSGPLTTVVGDNGRYRYGSGGVMPDDSWNSTNYFVDVEFVVDTAQPTAPPTVVTTTPVRDAVQTPTDVAITAIVDRVPTGQTLTLSLAGPDGAVAGSSSFAAATRTLSFAPTAALKTETPYTATVSLNGAPLDSWTFRTAARVYAGTTETLFGQTVPASASASDTDPVEVGTAFEVAEAGKVTAIRFYKGAQNLGVHRGTLWAPDGSILGRVTFTGETASGWQRAELDTPVDIVPGVTYVVSYYAPQGRFAIERNYFDAARTSGRITAPGGANGRFLYVTDGGFPTGSWGASAYFVDAEIVFPNSSSTPSPSPSPSASPSASPSPSPTPAGSPTPTAPPAAPAVTSTSPAASATNVTPAGATISATLTNATDATIGVTDGGATVAGTSAFNASSGVVTFTPSAALSRGKTYSVAVTVGGTAVTGGSWTFSTTPVSAITASTPASGATNVSPATASISATLSNASTATITLADGATQVAGSSAFTASSGTVVFTPTAALARGKTYTVTVTADGGPVAQGSWTFATTPPAALSARTPAASATNVDPASASVTATLTNAASATIALTYNGSAVAGTSSFNAATGVVTFSPTVALVRARTYSATVTAEGQALTGGTWTFTTIPNPAITARTPAASATRVLPGSPITATITNASAAAITVTSNGANVPGSSAFDTATGVVTFTPTATLAWNRTYSVTATANGAALTSGTWSFTTTPQAARTAVSPASGATNVNPASVTISATLTNAVTATLGLKLGTADVAGTSTYNSVSGVVTFTPTAALDWTKTYTATVTANNAAVTNGSWSFTTMAKPDQVSMFTTAGTPANANATAGQAVQTGTRFRTSVAGVVTTIRFFKGNQNTGTHTGYLRSATGAILAQVTFSGESASGWQSAVLSTPVRLTPGTEYRVTLYASSGRYSTTQNAFTSPVTYGLLTALGGVSGTGTANPTSLVASNFWIDVVFDPDN